MSEVKITFDELMSELDKFGDKRYTGEFTDQQKEFIIKARNKRVSYRVMCTLWEKAGWGKISKSTLRDKTIKFLEETNGTNN